MYKLFFYLSVSPPDVSFMKKYIQIPPIKVIVANIINVPATFSFELISGCVVKLTMKVVKYPNTPTIPRDTSTATSEQYSQVIQPVEFWKQNRKKNRAPRA